MASETKEETGKSCLEKSSPSDFFIAYSWFVKFKLKVIALRWFFQKKVHEIAGKHRSQHLL